MSQLKLEIKNEGQFLDPDSFCPFKLLNIKVKVFEVAQFDGRGWSIDQVKEETELLIKQATKEITEKVDEFVKKSQPFSGCYFGENEALEKLWDESDKKWYFVSLDKETNKIRSWCKIFPCKLPDSKWEELAPKQKWKEINTPKHLAGGNDWVKQKEEATAMTYEEANIFSRNWQCGRCNYTIVKR